MQQYLTEWHQEVVPLLEQCCALYEAELTPDQIQSIFQNAEQYAVDSKQYMTRLGKAGTAAKLPATAIKQLNDRVNELARRAQNTKPIQGLDRSFEEAKKKLADSLGGDSSKVVAAVNKLATLTKDNPGKSAFLVGLVTIAAAVAGGPLGGAGVGFLLRAGREVLAGEKLSTAVGKSLKTAGIGALVGVALEPLADMVSGALGAEVEQVRSQVTGDNLFKVEMTEINDGSTTWMSERPMLMQATDYQQYQQLMSEVQTYQDQLQQIMQQALPQGVPTNAVEDVWFEKLLNWQEQISDFKDTELAEFTKKITDPEYIANIQGSIDQQVDNTAIAQLHKSLGTVIQSVAQAVAQETAAAKQQPQSNQVSDSVDYELALLKRNSGIPLTESEKQIIAEFDWEGIKKNLGQKITARKLQKIWQKAGSPTDSAQIAQVLASAGLDKEGIEAISTTTNIQLPAPVEKPDVSTDSDNSSDAKTGSSTSAPSGSDDDYYDDTVERIKRGRKAAGLDDEEEADTTQKPEKKTQITFPGTDMEFKSGWISADDLTAANPNVSAVLDKLASGVKPQDLSTSEILAGRQKLARHQKKPEPATESLREMINRKLGL